MSCPNEAECQNTGSKRCQDCDPETYDLFSPRDKKASGKGGAGRDAPKPTNVVEVMESNARKASNKKNRPVQSDLHGEKVELPEGIVEIQKISRTRKYLDTDYYLSISEKDLLEFDPKMLRQKRSIVASKLRANKGTEYDKEEHDQEIMLMVEALSKASIALRAEVAAGGSA